MPNTNTDPLPFTMLRVYCIASDLQLVSLYCPITGYGTMAIPGSDRQTGHVTKGTFRVRGTLSGTG